MHDRSNSRYLRQIGLGSYFRPNQVEAQGIPHDRLRRLETAGVVERVARGLYRLADAEPTEHHTLAAVCARGPSSIVCLLSALEVHEIGSRVPREIRLAIHHKARPPRVPGIRVHLLRFSGVALDARGIRNAVRGRSRPHHVSGSYRGRLLPVRTSDRARGRLGGVVRCHSAPKGDGRRAGDTLRVLPSCLLDAALETREP